MHRVYLLGLVLVWFSLSVQALAGTAHKSETNPSELVNYHITQDEADRPVSSESDGHEEPNEVAGAPSPIRPLGKHRSDRSVAGGGVIIGGLVTAIFAAVFCYIRVTRKKTNGVIV